MGRYNGERRTGGNTFFYLLSSIDERRVNMIAVGGRPSERFESGPIHVHNNLFEDLRRY